jgi:hypothetical protein
MSTTRTEEGWTDRYEEANSHSQVQGGSNMTGMICV